MHSCSHADAASSHVVSRGAVSALFLHEYDTQLKLVLGAFGFKLPRPP